MKWTSPKRYQVRVRWKFLILPIQELKYDKGDHRGYYITRWLEWAKIRESYDSRLGWIFENFEN